MATTEKDTINPYPLGVCSLTSFLPLGEMMLCELSEHDPIVPTFRQEWRDGKQQESQQCLTGLFPLLEQEGIE